LGLLVENTPRRGFSGSFLGLHFRVCGSLVQQGDYYDFLVRLQVFQPFSKGGINIDAGRRAIMVSLERTLLQGEKRRLHISDGPESGILIFFKVIAHDLTGLRPGRIEYIPAPEDAVC